MMMNVKEILYVGSTIAKTSNRTLLILLTAVFDQSRNAMEQLPVPSSPLHFWIGRIQQSKVSTAFGWKSLQLLNPHIRSP